MAKPAFDEVDLSSMAFWSQTAREREPSFEVLVESLMGLTSMALGLAEERRARPADDLMTALVQAGVDGDMLTDPEIGAFFVLLAVAGNDSTATRDLELRSIFDELLHRLPALEVGQPEYLAGSFIHGVKRMPLRVGPPSPGRP